MEEKKKQLLLKEIKESQKKEKLQRNSGSYRFYNTKTSRVKSH